MAETIPEVIENASNADVLRVMTRAVFQAGVSWAQIAKHWDAYERAFEGFDVPRVSSYGEIDVERILGEPGILLHGVSIHPGKPTIVALAGGKPVFGLPGNPVSAMVLFELFVSPTIKRLLGQAEPDAYTHVRARMARRVASAPGREDYVQASVETRDGELWASPIFGKSNLIFTMVNAAGMIHVPLDRSGLDAGEWAEVRLF